MTSSPRRAGFTLVELIIAITVGGFVLGAIFRVMQGNQRFYSAQSLILDIQQNVRAVVQVLPGDLRELDAGDGDIIAMSDTSITIKAMRGLAITCTAPNVGSAQITVRNTQTFGYRAMDAARDSVLIFRDGNISLTDDDTWLRAPIAGMASGTCADGTTGTQLTLTGMIGGTAQLGPNSSPNDDGVLVGAPLRSFEVVTYRLYDDGTGMWWLGIRNYSGGAWSATSPIAGPLRANDGLNLEYRDASGNVTAVPTDVAQIRLTVRGRSVAPINIPGRPSGYYEDSLSTRIALRNNARS